jgi:hypothetical protein
MYIGVSLFTSHSSKFNFIFALYALVRIDYLLFLFIIYSYYLLFIHIMYSPDCRVPRPYDIRVRTIRIVEHKTKAKDTNELSTHARVGR